MRFRDKISLPLRIMLARIKRSKIPLLISWEVTRRCNYRCAYCDIWKDNLPELSTDQILSIIGGLSSCGTRAISFVGGEPLLRDDIGDIILFARKKNIYVKLTSNGSLVNSKIDLLKMVDLIKITLNGPRQIHDPQRQQGSYDQVIQAIHLLKKEKINVGLNAVISKQNLKYIDFILNIAQENDIKATFQPLEPRMKDNSNIIEYFPDEKEYKETLTYLIEKKKKGVKALGNSLDGLIYLYNWPHKKNLRCWAGIFHFRIDYKGDIYACDRLTHNKSFNCLEVGIKEAIKNIDVVNCQNSCWRNSTIEVNNLLSLKPRAIFNSA
ncbi:MAG: radical SAM protein, partial [Candidatus Omnitrophica bacterium]|nr:radical SAM protein [Candidatus Omnitrophota bacterium]